MPSKRPSILPEALRKLSRRPVSSRWRYWEGSVSSRLTRRRGSQKPSVSRTSVSGKGLSRTCGLFEVSTTMTGRCVESSMGLLISGRVLASSRLDGVADHAGDAVALQSEKQYNGRPRAPSDSIDPSLTPQAMLCNTEQSRERKTVCLSGNCRTVQSSVTADRTRNEIKSAVQARSSALHNRLI